MAVRKTRSAKPAAGEASVSEDAKTDIPPSSSNPPLLFILPQERSADARILSLPNPATGKQARFFFDPKTGIHEFTAIAAPKSLVSSWLVASDAEDKDSETEHPIASGYTIEQPSLYVATPIDPMLMVLPVLTADLESSERQLYLSMDDHLEKVSTYSKDLAEIITRPEVQARLESRMAAVCDKIEAGDDSMYRINEQKLSQELLAKAQRVCSQGLPASMEQKFVQELLQMPTTVVDMQMVEADVPAGSSQEASAELSQVSATSTTTSNIDSQASQASAGSILTAATSVDGELPSTESRPVHNPEIERLLRLRTAFNFILASYVPPALHARLRSVLKDSQSGVDFTPLDAHLQRIDELKKEAQALRSLSDNISRKRRSEDDDEAEELRAEKRRKKEEEDAKKKAQSRAIKQLSKADTSGMKKLSSFFTKGPAKKAAS